MKKKIFISLESLNRALIRVQNELIELGFYDKKLADTDIQQINISRNEGYYIESEEKIYIPWFNNEIIHQHIRKLGKNKKLKKIQCLNKYIEVDPYTSLADVIRHEYGHAFATTHKSRIKTKKYFSTFHANYADEFEWEYDKHFFVTKYAAKKPYEDFAECFMFYVKYKGKLPNRFNFPAIRKKWKFIDELRK